MKDGRTHLAYKAEHAVDLETQVIVAATVTHADRSDPETGVETLIVAKYNLQQAGRREGIQEMVADKGYHDNRLLAQCVEWQVLTSFNRQRVRREKGKRLNRWHSERCERSFAHVCETGGARRSWLRGVEKVTKAYLMRCAAYNLGVLMRKVFGWGKPRGLQKPGEAWFLSFLICWRWMPASRGEAGDH